MFEAKTVSEVVTKKIIRARYSKSAIEGLIREDAEAQGFKVTKLNWNASVVSATGSSCYGEIKQLTIKADARELPKKTGAEIIKEQISDISKAASKISKAKSAKKNKKEGK